MREEFQAALTGTPFNGLTHAMLNRTLFSFAATTLVAAFVWVWLGGGALPSDLGGDPDEPAHAVTSLMVRDYVAGITSHAPMPFARAYYEDFPKVALGHYPPGYYLLTGAALLVNPSRDTLLVVQCLLGIAVGLLSYFLARRFLPPYPSLVAALLAAGLPVMLKTSQVVMADSLLVVLVLWALLVWLRQGSVPTWKVSLFFGLLAAAAILTKGSGLLLGALPVGTLVLQRQFGWLRQKGWWAALPPVALLAGPWMVLTVNISKEGMTGLSTLEFFRQAIPHYALVEMPAAWGWLLTSLSAIGFCVLILPLFKKAATAEEAVLLSALAGGVAILLLVPVGLTSRYLAPLLPLLAILALKGGETLAFFLPSSWRTSIACALALGGFALVAGLPEKQVHGFSEAVSFILKQEPPTSGAAKARWIISSEPRGEGAVIAEAAFRLSVRSPSPLRIYRAGKELSTSDWMGRGYKLAFETEAEILTHLDKTGIRWVLVDLSVPEKLRVAHNNLLEAAMKGAPDRWELALTQPVIRQPGATGELLVYRRKGS